MPILVSLQTAMPPGGEDWELVTSPAAYGSATLGAFDRLQATLRDEHTVQMLVRRPGLQACTWEKQSTLGHNCAGMAHLPYCSFV